MLQNSKTKKEDLPVNAPLPTHRLHDVTDFVFAVIIIAVAFGAGHAIYQSGNEIAAQQQSINQAAALNY